MPSNAWMYHLPQLLADARAIQAVHEDRRTGYPGRQYGLGALNRAAVVTCMSAWESYIEQVVRESMQALRPAAPPFGVWQAFNSLVEGQLSRFNTPTRDNVRVLLMQAIGLPDIHLSWKWQNSTTDQAVARLTEAMTFRHEIAHGVNPRPVIHFSYANGLRTFILRLAQCTDVAIRRHLVNAHGIAHPWPE